jgi:hypothetical protein
MRKFFAVFFLILAVSTLAAADVYVKSQNHSDAMAVMGQSQPAKDTISEQWIGDGQVAMVSPDRTVLIDLKKNVMDIINHKNKTYVEATLPLDFASLMPPQMASMMQGMMKMTVTVAPTGQKKTFGQWSCDEYDVAMTMMMMPMKMKVYATTNVPFDLKDYMEKIQSNILKSQLRLDDASVAEMAKVKGFWIASETTGEMMGAKIRSTMEVVEISKKAAPAGVYSVPAGYAKQDKFSMQDMQNK